MDGVSEITRADVHDDGQQDLDITADGDNTMAANVHTSTPKGKSAAGNGKPEVSANGAGPSGLNPPPETENAYETLESLLPEIPEFRNNLSFGEKLI